MRDRNRELEVAQRACLRPIGPGNQRDLSRPLFERQVDERARWLAELVQQRVGGNADDFDRGGVRVTEDDPLPDRIRAGPQQ